MTRVSSARSASPSAVTLGETPQAAKVDWLTVTWHPDPEEHVPAMVLDLLRIHGIAAEAEAGHGHFGFANGARIFCRLDDGAKHQLALLDWGGDRMRGRARLDLSGSACSRIGSMRRVHEWIHSLSEPVITRVDLAVDCLNGEFSVDDAKGWLEAGQFTAGEGRPPRHSTPGDWLSPTPFYGRTLEIGRRENGKMLRAYEKGLQLAPGSGDKWTRFEVELRRRDRDIPLDVLTRCDEYFAGAYKCLAQMVEGAPQRISTHQKEGDLSMDRLVHYARAQYGKVLHVLRGVVSSDELVELISRPGVPRRLEKASVSGFSPSMSYSSV